MRASADAKHLNDRDGFGVGVEAAFPLPVVQQSLENKGRCTQAKTCGARRRGTRRPACKRWLALAIAASLVFAGWQLGQGVYIPAKAWLAQVLLERSWQLTLNGDAAVKPWLWADTYPVARIEFPRQGRRYLVLAGSSGRTLAFGPGHVSGTALPGESGNSVIGGHRDTHFAVLANLSIGDTILVQRPDTHSFRYRVSRIEVVDKGALQLLNQVGTPRLTVTTCFPFDAVRAGGSLRYVVIAQREAALQPGTSNL